MNCAEVRALHSPYYDGELDTGVAADVARHLERCASCGETLRDYRRLSLAAADLPSPAPPDHLWRSLQQELAPPWVARITQPANPHWSMKTAAVSLAALAALLVVAISILRWHDVTGDGGTRPAFSDHIQQYLARFGASPDEAQQYLSAHYEARPVDLSESVRLVGYTPAVANGFPPEYELDGLYVWDLPCCRCVQGVGKRPDGTRIAVFEHGEAAPCCWLDDRTSTRAQCRGKECQILTLNQRLAASWKLARRQLTVIGARNQEGVERLVGWFD